ncbi:hypothetical protein FBEOM_13652 [Fusarium beomiforme]|uniref:Uncharacterized protein n=1 Tax=Fusarium beomiforme TaxID=44412 RepID=A0A9P5A5W8_9HYPO|nr:hypothetical protein FBEOM_13652 [Fusarium beomiforme]
MDNSKTSQSEQTSDIPSWLEFLNQRIEEERDELFSEAPSHEIVRDLLTAPEDDASAVSQAVTKFFTLYKSEADQLSKLEEQGAGAYLNSISTIVFEVATKVWYTSWKHDRLAEFVIAIKRGAADDYNEEDPQFVWIGWGLEAAAAEQWNAGHVDTYTAKNSTEPEDVWAGEWFSTSGLIAKLFQGGCLDNDGHFRITKDLERTFEGCTSGDVKTDAGRQAQVLAAVNYIILAGETFVKGAKNPSPKGNFELSARKWKFWASKIKEVAETVDKDARWDLKDRAQKAYDKMVELYPEAFSSEKLHDL